MEKIEETTPYDFQSIETKWISQWDKNQIYTVEAHEAKPKYYCLDTYPYPSAEGVHIGYVKSYGGMDIIARYKRMKGFNVLYPMGWDTFGLPAENYAIKSGRHPKEITDDSIQTFKRQFKAFGLSYDWQREISTADPEYYKWTQWLFLVLFKKGLAYRKQSAVNWCPKDQTVVANEQVVDGKCERCGTDIIQKELLQWFFKVTEYADRLYEDSDKLDWEQKYLNVHKNWIGKTVEDGQTSFHIRDWCVSRQRYWGPPIPIIYCDACGVVPVPEKDLPVILPETIDLTPTGESPLAKNEDFVNVSCPTCGKQAKREVDILDTFVSSAWYQFRFTDPHNRQVMAAQEKLKYWGSVDHYQGTIEHLTAHLIYARFITKVLFDQGHVPFDEPFPKFTPVGLLVDKTGEKFSKRFGNAPDTNELIQKYGGDLLRLSCYFITPFGDISRWSEQNIVGIKKFRDRIWRIFKDKVDRQAQPVTNDLSTHLHQLVKEVEENIQEMRFNVALSKMMVFVTEAGRYEGVIDSSSWETFTKLLAPFAPFIAEEMWSQLGHSTSVHQEPWPSFDPRSIGQDVVTMTVQVNGKLKGVIEVPKGSTQEEVIKAIEADSKLQSLITSSSGKIIFVTDKVINFVLA